MPMQDVRPHASHRQLIVFAGLGLNTAVTFARSWRQRVRVRFTLEDMWVKSRDILPVAICRCFCRVGMDPVASW